ncbi:MAG: PP2C family protein-serine/threonine phosphatase [Chloroflexi bacterium]|nr:PP2C family protein-serine/threonine phosphatase [Chloroflexota bacterium]
MLASIFNSHQIHIEGLAKQWINGGASSFSLWVEEQMMACWPEDIPPGPIALTAPIRVNKLKIGEFQVRGISKNVEAQKRLENEANLIGDLARVEQDLNSMAAALIDARDQFWALYKLTQATRTNLNMVDALEALAVESTRLVNAQGVFIWVEPKDAEPYLHHYPELIISNREIHALLKEMLDVDNGLLCRRNRSFESSYHSLLCVPIHIRGTSSAALGMVNKIEGVFRSPDIKLAKIISEYAGTLIEKVIYYQENLKRARLDAEMELANRVQIQLFPRQLPQIDGIDFWAVNQAASHVGGDFYDFRRYRADAPFTFVVGDVSGKGTASALLMAMTRSILRTHMQVASRFTPQTIIAKTNRDLYDDFTRVNMFATVFVGQFDPVERKLAMANAGHSPVIYCPANGSAQLLPADSTPIGIMEESLAQNQQLFLQSGDIFMVGSDGLYEAHNSKGEMFGHQRLMNLIESVRREPARIIAEDISRAVSEFGIDSSQEDDRTIVILKSVQT